MAKKGTYGVYEKVRPYEADTSKIFETYHRTKLAIDENRRRDEQLEYQKRIREIQEKQAARIDPIEIEKTFKNFNTELANTATVLNEQSSTLLLNAYENYKNGNLSEIEYKKLAHRIESQITLWNENTKKGFEQYGEYSKLNPNDYKKGTVNSTLLDYNNKVKEANKIRLNENGYLIYNTEKGDVLAGDYMATLAPVNFRKSRRDDEYYDAIRDNIDVSQFIYYDDEGQAHAKRLSDDEFIALRDKDANSHALRGLPYTKSVLSNWSAEDYVSSGQFDNIEDAKANSSAKFDDDLTSWYQAAISNEIAKSRASKKETTSKGDETYYPEITKTYDYKDSYGEEKVDGDYVVIDTSKIKGSIPKETVTGEVVQMDGNGQFVIENGKYKMGGELPEKRGVGGQIKRIIKPKGDDYYYIEMIKPDEKDLSMILDASGDYNDVISDQLKKNKTEHFMLRLDESQLRDLQVRIPGALDVFGKSENSTGNVIIDGKEYTVEALKEAGWTDDDIKRLNQ